MFSSLRVLFVAAWLLQGKSGPLNRRRQVAASVPRGSCHLQTAAVTETNDQSELLTQTSLNRMRSG